mmetsp:Transcript_22202/g.71963  ORF Transcript_22202/g.71963 Transcript_22202/m.71963 type:complete len:467 (+) Transcript_22202:39-1439(+)
MRRAAAAAAVAGGAAPGGRKRGKTTISSRFRDDLNKLMRTLDERDRHYVRCIKPNTRLVKQEFEDVMVREQLSCQAVPETVEIRMNGYMNRYLLERFVAKFRVILLGTPEAPPRDASLEDWARAIMRQIEEPLGVPPPERHSGPGPAPWQLGKTKIFLKETAFLIRLEELRNAAMEVQVKLLQSYFRMVPRRRWFRSVVERATRCQAIYRGERFRRQRRWELAATRCQAVYRGSLVRRQMRWELAATRCQAIFRGSRTRRRLHDYEHRREPAARLIQRQARAWPHRRRFRALRSAVLACQGFRRASLAARAYRECLAAIARFADAGPSARRHVAGALRRAQLDRDGRRCGLSMLDRPPPAPPPELAPPAPRNLDDDNAPRPFMHAHRHKQAPIAARRRGGVRGPSADDAHATARAAVPMMDSDDDESGSDDSMSHEPASLMMGIGAISDDATAQELESLRDLATTG